MTIEEKFQRHLDSFLSDNQFDSHDELMFKKVAMVFYLACLQDNITIIAACDQRPIDIIEQYKKFRAETFELCDENNQG